jgi:putative membrane protein
MDFLYSKALHVIFVVTWFSGMFYLVRLFIYNREANDKQEPERSILQKQFGIMIRRLLFGITWPSAILTLLLGLWLLYLYPAFPLWLQIKLGFALGLFLYHYSLHIIYRQQADGNFKYTSSQLRIWNEVATIFLVAIVMLVIVKQELSPLYGLLGLAALMVLIMGAIRIYKALRK